MVRDLTINRLERWLVCGFAWAFSACSHAVTHNAAVAAQDSAAVRAAGIVDSIRQAQRIPGMSVVVLSHGRALFHRELGFGEMQTNTAVTASTRFRIGSVSKLLTAATAARLAQRGALDLDAPIQRYIADYPSSSPPITARLLAGHLGGVRHYGRNDYMNTVAFPSVQASLVRFKNDALVAVPGTKYFYSTFGYTLLGAVVEQAAGGEYASVVRRELLDVVGMPNTSLNGALAPAGGAIAHPYQLANGMVSDAPPMDLSDRWPAGGWTSTASDLAKFATAAVEGPLLTAEMRTTMFTPQTTTTGEHTSVGLGWRIGRDSAGRRFVHHGGDAIGGRAFVLAYPDDGLVIAMTCNLGLAALAEREGQLLANVFLK